MSHLPEIRARSLARRGTLTGDLIAGATGVELPIFESGFSPGSAPADRPVRLDASAFGCSSEAAEAKLEAILAGSGQLVTTGQQPLLFLGPLFVLYKALTAIELARRLEADTGTPTLATFWIASDDHDWAEVGSASVIDVSGELKRLRLAPPNRRAGHSVGTTAVDASIERLIDELSQALPDSEFAPTYVRSIERSYEVGRSLGEAFASALAQTLEGFDFAWLDSADPGLKRASVPLFHRIIDGDDRAEEALSEGTRRLRDAGHDAPIPLLRDAYPLFLDTEGGRERLYRAGDGFSLGRDGERATRDDLTRWLNDTPERFSPNVASRPVLESWLLPVAATVLGPGEIAYWSQLPPLFALYDVPVPRIRPRAAWTLVESKIARVLDRLGASLDDLADGGAALATRVTRDFRPPATDAALDEFRKGVATRLDALEGAVGEELPGLRSAVGKARKRIFDAIGEVGSQVDARVRDLEASSLQSIQKCAVHLFPDGDPQERVVSPYYYLARYGHELIVELSSRTRTTFDEADGDT